jgi:hypothetical protein
MRPLFAAVLFAGMLALVGAARAAGGCGPGCHATISGACVVDGWGTGARVWNECPAGVQPRPPCIHPYVWRKGYHACFAPN